MSYKWKCLDCGYEFDEPYEIVENRAPEPGLWWPERQKVCPNCWSPAFDEAWKVKSFEEDQD